jgi:hypothetical protein
MPGLATLLLLVSVISGVAGIFVDPQQGRNRWLKPFLFSFITIPALASIWIDQYFHAQYEKRVDSATTTSLDFLTNTSQKQWQKCGDLYVTYDQLVKNGKTVREVDDIISKSKTQQQLASEILARDVGVVSSENSGVTVVYFSKDRDPSLADLLSRLGNLGFTVTSKASSDKNKLYQTNALWFGSEVPLTTVKTVALGLLRSGINLQGIQPLIGPAWSSPSTSRQIQIVNDVDYVDKPTLTAEYIQSAKDFPLPR